MNKRWFVYTAVLLFLSWYLFLGISQFPYTASGEYSDFTISHYPNLVYTQDSLRTWHQIPLWNSMILSGNPFAADPLSSLWYLPYWLAIVLPAPFGLNLLTILHLVAGGLGLAVFAKSMGYTDLAAYAGGIVFLLMPKLYAHFGAGHVSLIWAVCLTPWLLFLEYRANASPKSVVNTYLPAFMAGLILLADIRWGVWSWLLWWSYALYLSLKPGLRVPGKWYILFARTMLLKLKQGVIAVLAASPLLLPLIQFTSLSTRGSITPADTLTLSLPPASLFGFFFPNFGGSAEWTTYFGIIPVFLLFIAATRKTLRVKSAFWLAWFLISLVVSLGDALPGAIFAAKMPLVSMLRVPPRALFVAGLCMSVITVQGFQELTAASEQKNKKPFRLGVAGFTILIISLAALFASSVEKPAGFIWGAVFSGLAGCTLLCWSYRILARNTVFCIFGVLLLLDLGYVSTSMLRFEQFPAGYSETLEMVQALKTENVTQGRVYSPSYSIPQDAAVINGIRLADGIDPLHLATYSSYMEIATGVENNGYSVTIPAFESGTPETDNQHANPDAEKLGALNVTGVVSAFPLESTCLELLHQSAGRYIYRNNKAMLPAWVQQNNSLEIGNAFQAAEILLYSPNKVSVRAVGPGFLVLADPMYPGWTAKVDGQKADIIPAGGLLRSVKLAEGSHTVEFLFRPLLLYIGIILQFLVVFIILISNFLQKKQAL